jgi:putative lipoprotein (rSAM/lipoprotein system)
MKIDRSGMKLKNKFLNLANKILLILISLLGFATSCEKFSDSLVEYGTPHADFIINGTIKSKQSNQGIQNIKIAVSEIANLNSEGNVVYEIITNSKIRGKFVLKYTSFPQKQSFLVKIRDIDSTKNGSFMDKDTIISFSEVNFQEGDGHWYRGKTEQTIEFFLIPRQ